MKRFFDVIFYVKKKKKLFLGKMITKNILYLFLMLINQSHLYNIKLNSNIV